MPWSKRTLIWCIAAFMLHGGAALAAMKTIELTELGLFFKAPKGAKLEVKDGGEDKIASGKRGGITIKVIVRPGVQLPASQHHFRLMSYFPGEWNQTPDTCRGTGWTSCESWSWKAESGGLEGLGMAGHGPGGTYLFVLAAPDSQFKARRPQMREIQSSVELR